MKKFLREHEDILILKIDKSNNVAVWPKSLYTEKMLENFRTPKFQKLNYNPLKLELAKYRKNLQAFLEFIPPEHHFRYSPIASLPSATGLPKYHKENLEIRPIVSTYNGLCSRAEGEILKHLNPLLKTCKYLVNSTLEFKNKILGFFSKYIFKSRMHFSGNRN